MAAYNKLMCAICQTSLGDDSQKVKCPSCAALYHAQCWDYNGGCAAYGCERSPQRPEKAAQGNTQPVYREAPKKYCPMCGRQISAHEIRCPFCSALLVRPQQVYSDDRVVKVTNIIEQEVLRKRALTIFIGSLFGITGPFVLLIGGIWYAFNKRALQLHYPLYSVLAAVGLCISAFYTFLIYLFNR